MKAYIINDLHDEALNLCSKALKSNDKYGLKIIDSIQIETQNKNNINIKLFTVIEYNDEFLW